jgi:hypothetical protein
MAGGSAGFNNFKVTLRTEFAEVHGENSLWRIQDSQANDFD